MKEYRGWEILEKLPDGWKIDKTCGSPLAHTVFITNGKSVIYGQKRALLKVGKNPANCSENQNSSDATIKFQNQETKTEDHKPHIFPSKTVNELARKKVEEILLKDIKADLMVCELEGWDKKEYIKELQDLLNGFDL